MNTKFTVDDLAALSIESEIRRVILENGILEHPTFKKPVKAIKDFSAAINELQAWLSDAEVPITRLGGAFTYDGNAMYWFDTAGSEMVIELGPNDTIAETLVKYIDDAHIQPLIKLEKKLEFFINQLYENPDKYNNGQPFAHGVFPVLIGMKGEPRLFLENGEGSRILMQIHPDDVNLQAVALIRARKTNAIIEKAREELELLKRAMRQDIGAYLQLSKKSKFEENIGYISAPSLYEPYYEYVGMISMKVKFKGEDYIAMKKNEMSAPFTIYTNDGELVEGELAEAISKKAELALQMKDM